MRAFLWGVLFAVSVGVSIVGVAQGTPPPGVPPPPLPPGPARGALAVPPAIPPGVSPPPSSSTAPPPGIVPLPPGVSPPSAFDLYTLAIKAEDARITDLERRVSALEAARRGGK